MSENFEFDKRNLPKYILLFIVAITIILLNFYFIKDYISSNSNLIKDYSLRDEDITPTREAAVSGLFYPADAYQLETDVDGYLKTVISPISYRPQIMIVPHAGYMYSAEVAAKAYQQLIPFSGKIKKIIILGPSHRVNIKGVALSSAGGFRTPLGRVSTDKELTEYFSQQKGFTFNNFAHKDEHAIEVQLPFLQKTLSDFTIVPMLYGNINSDTIAKALSPLLKKDDTLLIISADLSHYLDLNEAVKQDAQTIDMVNSGENLKNHQSCGATGINTAMYLAKTHSLKPKLLDISNSGEVSGVTDSVVGYASWIYAGEPELDKQLSPLEQEVENLTNFARHNMKHITDIVTKSLSLAVEHKHYIPTRDEYPNSLFDKGASFVTLKIDNKLRGCIGSLLPSQAIATDIADNTYSAAMADERFSPLQQNELANIRFTVSLLSGYERISFKSEEDLLNKIVKGKDGLVIRDGDRQGVLLPSVWNEITDSKEFLTTLKIKAGLSPSYWSDNIKIFRFRTVEVNE
ncbi:MAG: AmmeMemoRadiSam system protein B [Alphaproteobacteria bacterium]|nr:AmmeMemoRadiSam system protein B [Alphaproteobacteria bacterium]